MKTLVKTVGDASLYKDISYNHRITPEVTWLVKSNTSGLFVCAVKTKQDALEWLKIYSNKA
jgi:hypothetical protein